MEQKYRRLARPELPSCEEYYLYEDYGPDLALVPLRDEPAAPAVLFGLPAPGVPHGTGSAEPAPAVTAHDLRLHSADQSEHPPIWSARYVEHDTPGEMGANRGHLVNVTVRNTSVGTWRSDGRIAGRVVLSYRWRRPDGELVIPQGDITLLPQALPPGEEARVVAGLWTPAEPGDYRLEWQMLCERVAWFSDHGVVPLEHEAHVVDRGPRPVAPHFPQPLTSPNHVRQRTSSGTAGVALTFDDGPDPEWTPRILERLRRLDAPATFFVLGARAAAHPRLLRRMRRDGHQIGLHGNLHLRHDEHAAEVISADTAEALSAIGGRRRTRLWRTPHGIATPDTERVAEEHGLELIHWTADTQDWQGGQTAGEMLARVEPLLRPGAVVLMHDGVGPGSPRENAASTLALLDPLVEAVRAKGLQLTVVAPG
jgi:peptidoglycan/xylan/chitin deacetylase (PgdA/CDA1 family)